MDKTNSQTTLTTKKDWSEYYDKNAHTQEKKEKPVAFSELFDAYLKPDKNKTVLEIGCAGGDFLYHIHNKFSHIPYGIDYSEKIELTRNKFSENGAVAPTLYLQDLMTWTTEKKFDVVCSFGFVEHFENFDFVIKKHADLVSNDGLLILTIPHFSHGQYFLHWLLDRKNLKLHNTKIMNLRSFKKAFAKLPFEIKELSYYGTFAFWMEKKLETLTEKILYRVIRIFGVKINRVLGENRPNFMFSPFIVCVAKRK
ncbi:MAG: class I SAM-dependent methyltransferase [Candidatus Pacebacteria bacterium]|jgi:2-polyprenyl-3-methyl-5-hydroxy-6-metoxy-1,4-benzoquinol methylase|nr:class I SAM-dependent methyltransferase [Candidatus Paceibacterota bacterium]